MGILRRIFGNPEDASKVVDGAVRGLDAIVFTEEERAEYSSKLGDWYLKYLEASQGQNIARRMIALLVVGLWCMIVVTACAAWPFAENYSKFLFTVLDDVVMQPFTIVIGFYFLTHTVRAYAKEKNKNG